MIYERLKRLTQHSAIYALGPAVHKAIGFLLIPLITAYIGTTANYGITEMAAVTAAIAGQLLGINLLYGMTRYYPEYESEPDRARLVGTTFLLLLATTGGALVLAFVFREQGAALLFDSPAYAPALVVVFGIVMLQALGQVGLRWLQILERSAMYGVLTTAKLLCEVGLKVWFLVGLGLTYMGVLYSVLCGELLIAIGMGGLIVVRLGIGFSWPMARRLFRYSAPLIVSGLCMFVLHQADRFYVLRLRGEDEVGLYGLAYKLGSMASAIFLEAFGLIWFPFVFAMKNEEDVRQLCRKVLTYFTLIMCAASLFLAVFSREIVGAMSDAKFHESYRALPLIAAGYVFWGVFQVVHTVFYVRERTGLVSLLVGGAAVLNLALNALLVPGMGYMGAAWATLATFIVLAIASWVVAERLMPIGYEGLRVALPIGLACLLYAASRWIGDGSLAGTIAQKSALVLALPVILWFGGYLKAEEKDKIKAILRRADAAG